MILRLLKAGILVWLLIMAGLLVHARSGSEPPRLISFASFQDTLEQKETWMGIYWSGERIGATRSLCKTVGDHYEISDHSLLQLSLAGTRQRIETRVRSVENRDLSLRSFSFQLSSSGASFLVQGVVNHGQLKLTTRSAGVTQSKTISLVRTPLLAHAVIPSLMQAGVKAGCQYRIPVFDPGTLACGDMLVSVEAEEGRIWEGRAIRTLRLRQSFKGVEAVTWATPDGIPFAEESPLGFTLFREDPRTAMSARLPNRPGNDFLAASAVQANGRIIAHPAAAKLLKVVLNDISGAGLDLDGGRQQLQGNLLIVRKEQPDEWSSYPLPCSREDMRQFLEPGPLIQSDHARIRQQAQEVIAETRDAAASVRLLVQWTHREIEKRPLVSVPSALEVLELRAGDCNEHAVLFTALARSCGIPARICTGLVYLNDRFYYHAWSEVFLGSWIAVDPTMNQVPADATHLRLVIGDLASQIKVLGLVGHLKLDIAECS